MFGIINSKTVSNLVDTMRQATMAMLANLGGAMGISGVYGGGSSSMAQEVNIYAEFPNAVDHDEIREALEGLIARSSQNANTFLK
jgi:2-phosphoglycerate kinase